MVSPFCDGVDLNCGCPQRWAKQQGLGCILLERPELIHDLVRQCRNLIPKPFTVSVKMRLQKDLRKSIEVCTQLEKCGVSFLTVHGRTPDQLTGDVNVEALRTIVDGTTVPIVANGGVKTLQECLNLQKSTNCRGVMVANGLLTNPTLFTGTSATTTECVQRWLNICYNTTLDHSAPELQTIPEKPNNLTFQCFHHHLVFMLEKILSRTEKRIFNNLQSFEDVLSFIRDRFAIVPELFDDTEFSKIRLINLDYAKRDDVYFELKPNRVKERCDDFLYDDSHEGQYFNSRVRDDCDWSDIFLENG
jgi:tRNA-dihydrouridine synthase 4